MAEPTFQDSKPKGGGGRKPPAGGFQRSSSAGRKSYSSSRGDDDRRSRRSAAKNVSVDAATDWVVTSMLQLQEYAWMHFLLYGPTGVGKSVAAASMPRALILACDRHANWVFRDDERKRVESLFPNTLIQFRAVRITNFHDMWAAYKVLEHGCLTGQWPLDQPLWSWVIDGATELQQVGADKVLDDMRHDAPDTHDYVLMKQDMRSLLLDLMKLPMHGLITAGEKNANNADNPMWIPSFTGALAEELPTHMDVVGRIGMIGDGRRGVCVHPGENHWAKDLTGRLQKWMGQNLQNWLYIAQGENWREQAKEARRQKMGLAPTSTVDSNAAPHPAAANGVDAGPAPDRAEDLNAALDGTPAEAATGKAVEKVQAERSGAVAGAPASPAAPESQPEGGHRPEGPPGGGAEVADRPPAAAEGPTEDGGPAGSPPQGTERQDGKTVGPANPPAAAEDNLAPLRRLGREAPGSRMENGLLPLKVEAWTAGMSCRYVPDGSTEARSGLVMAVQDGHAAVQAYDPDTNRLLSGPPVWRKLSELAPLTR